MDKSVIQFEEAMTMMNALRLRVAIGAALLTATFFLFLVRPAQAQSERLRATIPFGFYAGETLLPAGDYKVENLGSGVVRLFNRDTYASAIFHRLKYRRFQQVWPGLYVLSELRYGQDYMFFPNYGGQIGITAGSRCRQKLNANWPKPPTPIRIALTKR